MGRLFQRCVLDLALKGLQHETSRTISGKALSLALPLSVHHKLLPSRAQ